MSSIWKKPTFGPRQLENQWMNNIYCSHDLWCHCEDPPLHLLAIINRNSKAPKPEKEIINIKCLLTGEGGTENHGEEDAGLEDGELERLFAEDGTGDPG